MTAHSGWFHRQRTGLWHLRKRGFSGYKDWKKRAEAPSEKAKVYGLSPKPVTISDVSLPVIASLATMPSRTEVLREAFSSIYWQVDEVHVFLNNFEEVPEFLNLPRVTLYRSQDYRDYKDVGKFFPLTSVEKGILFTVDDDILYPPDYVSRMLSYLAAVNYKAVIGVHGFQLPRFPKSFFDRRAFHFRSRLDYVALASVLGTGTTAFSIEEVLLTLEDFPSYGMADVHFATFMKKRHIPALLIPREAEWLKALAHDGAANEPDSLYAQTQRDSAAHTGYLRDAAPWGEEDTLMRWNSLAEDSLLDKHLVDALIAIKKIRQNSQSGVWANLASESDSNFNNRLEWLELYADTSTQEQILNEVVSKSEKASAATELETIKRLWKINATLGIEASRRALVRRPKDVAFLTQHANFCDEYYLPGEAEENYLRAVRLAGAKGLRNIEAILFQYFRSLIRAGFYQKALMLTASLKATHFQNQEFQALVVLASLATRDVDGARVWLHALFISKPSRPRTTAINKLVSAMAKLPSRTVSGTASNLLDVGELLKRRELPAKDLLALLKITTELRDAQGAEQVWGTLAGRFPKYIAQRPEITDYFRSNWEHGETYKVARILGRGAVNDKDPGPKSYADGPLISVVLTCQDSAETLEYAVKSVLYQTHQNFELIITANPNHSETIKTAQEWANKDRRITLHRTDFHENQRVSQNNALATAKGQYLAIQTADALSAHNRLALQLDMFQPGIMAVYGRQIRVDRSGTAQLQNNGAILCHAPETLMMRRQVTEEMGSFATVEVGSDEEFESRLEHFYGSPSVVYMDETLVYTLVAARGDSRPDSAALEEKRNLMVFKEAYTKNHTAGRFLV